MSSNQVEREFLFRLIVCLTLRVNYKSRIFRETVLFALTRFSPTPLPQALEEVAVDAFIALLEEKRAAVRAAMKDKPTTPGCDCGGCRVVHWASDTTPGDAPKGHKPHRSSDPNAN